MEISSTFFHGNKPFENPPRCFNHLLAELEDKLTELDKISKGTTPSTLTVKRHLDPWFTEGGWVKRAPIDNRFPRFDLPAANFDVDWQFVFDCSEHGIRHVVSFEYSFDNRQVVGTNLLKMEVVHRRFPKTHEELTLGILLTATRTALDAGGWDGGIATTEEYENAITHGYDQILTSDIIVMSIKA